MPSVRLIVAALLVHAAVATAQPAPPTAGPVPTPPAPTPPAPADPISAPPAASPAPGAPPIQEIPVDEPVSAPDDPDDNPDIQVLDDAFVRSIGQRVGLNLFGDASAVAGFERTDPPGGDPDTTPASAFTLGQLGMLLHAELSPRLSAVGELAFEFDDDNQPVADIERVQLQYLGDRVDFLAGRFHTEIGYWNTAYHHGSWLQLTPERPHAVQFEDEGGLVPAHTIGAALRLRQPAGAGRLEATIAVGNGRGDDPDDIQSIDDNNNGKSFLVKAESVGVGAHDLRFGATFMVDRIAPLPLLDDLGNPVGTRPALTELIGAGHVVYRGDRLTLISEAYLLARSGGGERWITVDAFAVAGWTTGRYTPYVEVEWAETPAATDPDPFSGPAPSFTAIDLGVRIELNTWSVVKAVAQLELRDHAQEAAAVANWSFGL